LKNYEKMMNLTFKKLKCCWIQCKHVTFSFLNKCICILRALVSITLTFLLNFNYLFLKKAHSNWNW